MFKKNDNFIGLKIKTRRTHTYTYIYDLTLDTSLGFTSNHRFNATELFRMVQVPHSSGNFND